MSAGVRRIVLLTLGWGDVAKSVSVEGAPHDQILREPVPGVLLLCDGGWLLLDTGYNTALITDLALRARFHRDPLEVPLLPGPGEPLAETLGAAGVDLADIQAVAVSHLHYDHAGGLKHFAGRVPVHIQRAELDYGMSSPPGPEENGIFRVDFDDPRIDWRTAEGDVEIAPGVTAVLTSGHTPGHQSFVVRHGPIGRRRGLRVRLRRGRPDREHRARGRRRRADRGVPGAERGPDPQAQADRRRRAATGWCPGTTRTSGLPSPPSWPFPHRNRPLRAGSVIVTLLRPGPPKPAVARAGPEGADVLPGSPLALRVDAVIGGHPYRPVAGLAAQDDLPERDVVTGVRLVQDPLRVGDHLDVVGAVRQAGEIE